MIRNYAATTDNERQVSSDSIADREGIENSLKIGREFLG